MTANLRDDSFNGSISPRGFEGSSVYLVTNPTDTEGNSCHSTLDDQVPRVGQGLNIRGLESSVVKSVAQVRELRRDYLYEVEVTYGPPDELTPTLGDAWQITWSGAVESVHTKTEVLSDEDEAEGKLPRIIGPYRFLPRDEQGPFGDTINCRAGDVQLKIQADPAQRKRIPVGAERAKGVINISAHKEFNGLAPLALFHSFVGRVNDGTVILNTVSYPAGTLLFQSCSVRDEIGKAPTPRIHVVDLTLIGSPDGFDHDVYHTYSNEEGDELIVVVDESTEGKNLAQSDALFGLAAGAPIRERFALQKPSPAFAGVFA